MIKNLLRRRAWLILGGGLLVGLLAAGLAFQYMHFQDAPKQPEVPKIETAGVVVASAAIVRGQRLTNENLQTVQWPVENIPENVLQELQQARGQVALRNFEPGEPLFPRYLVGEAGQTMTQGLVGLIPDGRRAITIEVNPVVGVGGFIQPTSMVDVLATRSEGTGGQGATTRTVLENIEILAINRQLNPEGEVQVEDGTTVTLLATPEQAQKIALISDEAQFHLTLRGPFDQRPLELEAVSLSNLWGEVEPEPQQPAPEPQPQGYSVQTIAGEQTGSVQVEQGGGE